MISYPPPSQSFDAIFNEKISINDNYEYNEESSDENSFKNLSDEESDKSEVEMFISGLDSKHFEKTKLLWINKKEEW